MMTRTVVAIDPAIKDWLDRRALEEGVPMTELVRQAVQLLKEHKEKEIDDILGESRGIWTQGDGLAYQQNARAEWPD
jgi:hypothetical protein